MSVASTATPVLTLKLKCPIRLVPRDLPLKHIANAIIAINNKTAHARKVISVAQLFNIATLVGQRCFLADPEISLCGGFLRDDAVEQFDEDVLLKVEFNVRLGEGLVDLFPPFSAVRYRISVRESRSAALDRSHAMIDRMQSNYREN